MDVRRRAKLIKESQDSRPPCALKFPAEPGWRVVWVDCVEPASGTVAIHPMVGVLVEPVTFWGFEAPFVAPDPNEAGRIESTLGLGSAMVHLHGPIGERLPPRARVFRIANPRTWMSDDQLREECRSWLNKVYTAQRREQRQRRKPRGGTDG